APLVRSYAPHAAMIFRPLPTPRQALMACVLAALTALLCSGLLGAAALVPAPHAVLPFVIAVCIGCPMVAAWELPASVTVLRVAVRDRGRPAQDPLEPWVLDDLLARLEELPETDH